MINQPKRHPIFVFVGLVAATVGLLFSGLQPVSWAAPEQHPNQQTVPPRPTETPAVVASPTTAPAPDASPTPEPAPPTDTDSDGSEDAGETNDAETPPTPASDSGDSGASDDVPETGDTTSLTNDEETEPVDPAASVTETTDEEVVDNAQSGETGTGLDASSAETADLSLLMQVNTPHPVVGETITLTVVITNSGPSAATAIVVRDVLPTGLIFEGATASRGRYGPGNGLWQIDTLLPNETGMLHLVGSVVGTGAVVNRAEIVAVAQADPDSVPNNSFETEDDYADVSLTVRGEVALDLEPVSNTAGQDVTAEEASSELATATDNGQFLYWLLALIGGGLLTVIGVVMVKRA